MIAVGGRSVDVKSRCVNANGMEDGVTEDCDHWLAKEEDGGYNGRGGVRPRRTQGKGVATEEEEGNGGGPTSEYLPNRAGTREDEERKRLEQKATMAWPTPKTWVKMVALEQRVVGLQRSSQAESEEMVPLGLRRAVAVRICGESVYTHILSLLLSSLTSTVSTMEAGPKLRLFAVAMMAVVMASSLVEKAAAAEAPAPSPTSGATTLASPAAVLASLSALLFGYFLG
ncbi:hypothetical protein B296_00021795 [Ensete ventricosum]|uniref:Uncharacterized protein n=1 Tax=Ensete ventricosum TaxID=4639 RepID=A0A426YLN7_ENSVE|nr:hypothetical protein B296_00021795 [Ensete ventricosum]